MVVRCFAAAGVLLLLLAPLAAAGSELAPEIKDQQYDQQVTVNGTPSGASTCGPAGQPQSCIYIPADVWSAWVEETPGSLHFNIVLAQAPPSTFGDMHYTVSFTTGGTTYLASATVGETAPAGSGETKPGDLATEADFSGTTLSLTVPKSAVPLAVPGANLTQLFVVSSGTGGQSGQQTVTDRAPSTGYGTDFRMAPARADNATGTPGNSTSSSTSTSVTTRPAPGTSPITGTFAPPTAPISDATGGKKTPLDFTDGLVVLLVLPLLMRRPRRPEPEPAAPL